MTNESLEPEFPAEQNAQLAEGMPEGDACEVANGGCPHYCRTTMFVRGTAMALVLMGAAAYGAILVKPELSEYIPVDLSSTNYPPARYSSDCSACGTDAMAACPCPSTMADAEAKSVCSACETGELSQCVCPNEAMPPTETEHTMILEQPDTSDSIAADNPGQEATNASEESESIDQE